MQAEFRTMITLQGGRPLRFQDPSGQWGWDAYINMLGNNVLGIGNRNESANELINGELRCGTARLISLPISDPGVPGALYRTGGQVMVSI